MKPALIVTFGLLLAAGSCSTVPKDPEAPVLTQAEAQACISLTADPDSPMGSYDVKRLTNTCQPEINIAFYSSDGRPTRDAPERPALSHDEWTRAYITQGSGGYVSYFACPVPQTIQGFPSDEGDIFCEDPQ
ncbi:MAG TPA: hypothetical protein PKA33_11650 [Amaricoccus sp.]|uniref:hypothetical protein n=1 Tax=Amaricoccus sp. TaxID=1872485 RepID=UPI002C4186D0|nr:hypothetical protein [Amaricoccus sp.]HMQ92410.1 hypothetical protein [Amaricoccus sp.]HMR53141.1 hypothetical protein [Amaricoccus sp.]HMR59422.1 hypothetical protein [Amaricoccus sp.]HMU00005.1 hypothetical protein [Amaricoccus sp.]